MSLAAQKFISEIANDALQHCKTRGANQNAKTKGKDRRYTLTMEDLTPAVAEYGIIVKKPHYFVWKNLSLHIAILITLHNLAHVHIHHIIVLLPIIL